jgi:hypothetical protein
MGFWHPFRVRQILGMNPGVSRGATPGYHL